MENDIIVEFIDVTPDEYIAELGENNELHLPIITDNVSDDIRSITDLENEQEKHLHLAPPVKMKKSRKRSTNKYTWKQQERQRKYQSGEEHINSRNKKVPKREIKDKKDCTNGCKLKCGIKINEQNRKTTFDSYYKMDQNSKYHFIAATTERFIKLRPKEGESRRSYSFRYFFTANGKRYQVCKTFYLSTLNISQKPIYNVHLKKDQSTGVVLPDMRGKSKNKHVVSEAMKENVRNHIFSFPVIDSHYCRARTSKKYLQSNLTITKMYNLYKEKCSEDNVPPVKESMYRYIFCTEFNIDFHQPKSDRCAVCEKFDVAKREGIDLSQTDLEQYNKHLTEKTKMREERQEDRAGEIPVICFDLENVITCPKAEISPLFYYKKMNVYNLTAHFSRTKKAYCALWTEYLSGRSGNDIASAFISILEKVVEENEFTDLITWSDSCVPQNRNSIIAYAILHFMKMHQNINSITMKYSIPGHSAIQEVDNIHSVIERAMNKTEFFSPLGIVRILKEINKTNPYCIIQLQRDSFKNYQECSKKLNFKSLPFASVTALKFTRNSDFETIQYRRSYETKDFEIISIKPRQNIDLPKEVPLLMTERTNRNDKREHFLKMIPFMGLQDRQYYKAVFKFHDDEMETLRMHPTITTTREGTSDSNTPSTSSGIRNTRKKMQSNAKENKNGKPKKSKNSISRKSGR